MRLVFILFIFSSFFLKAQLNHELKAGLQKTLAAAEKKSLEQADNFYKRQEYTAALPLYSALQKRHTDNLYLAYLLGTSQCYDADYFNAAEENIKSAAPIKAQLADYDFYLGKAYENNEKYLDAIAQFESYLKNELPDTLRSVVKHQVEVCRNSAQQLSKGTIAGTANLSEPVNSAASEYAPFLPLDESFIVYAYCGPKSKGGKQKVPGKPDEKGIYFEDIYISYKNGEGKFDAPKPIDILNTTGNDAPVYISHDGQKLYLFRNDGAGSGDIYVSYLKGTEWTAAERMKGINSNFWEGSICFTPDEKYAYFSSERPNGVGGRDIWIAQRTPDGSYAGALNLSTEINSPFDEDAPYITADGKTLFFSSNGHGSTGGYDIFRSDFKNGKWSTPYNIGKPVNTNQDDKYYWVSADGQRAYYSSERKGGFGLQDIYLVEPGMFGRPTTLVMISGKVYIDDKPGAAEIKIKAKHGRKDFGGTFTSNSLSGDYLFNLPAGNEFEIKYSHGDMSVVKSISTITLDSFASLKADANLYSAEFLKKLKMDSTELTAGITAMNYNEFLARYGNMHADSVDFKVQVGAYRIIENFNYNKLLQLPAVRRQTYADGITRFTLGEFKTPRQADDMTQQAKRAGIKDAFIIALYKNRRIPLEELIKGNYFKEK